MRKVSRKNSKSNKFIIFILFGALLALLLVRFTIVRGNGEIRVSGTHDIVVFLSEFGLDVDHEPVTVKNVQIPAKFPPVYERYNDLQKSQGFDLSHNRADIVESYTFRVLNHPASTDVFANVLVYKGRIIGGDLCSYAVDGFMTSFDGVTHN